MIALSHSLHVHALLSREAIDKQLMVCVVGESRGGTGGPGPQPEKPQVAIGFLRNTGTDPTR